MAMDAQIIRQSASYRHGLVLGLTMAEIMVLLVFCLLIAMAAFLKTEHSKLEAARDALKQAQATSAADREMVDAIRRDPRLADLLKGALGPENPAAIDEFWRDLVESRSVGAAAREAGLTAADIRQHGKDFKAVAVKSIDIDKAIRDAAIAASAAKAMAGSAPATPENVAKAIERGLSTQGTGGHRWPPIITLNDTKGQFFRSGSAELNPRFRQTLVETTPEILRLMKEYNVDVVEVVGHTDEKPVGVKQSNLDRDLLPVLRNETQIGSIVSADNAGLGLARAVSVVSVLRQNRELSAYKILPLSGGQLVDTDETLAIVGMGGDVAERRRIEIRLRKANPDAVKVVQSPAPPVVRVPPPTRKPAPPMQIQPLPPPPAAPATPPKPAFGPPDIARVQ